MHTIEISNQLLNQLESRIHSKVKKIVINDINYQVADLVTYSVLAQIDEDFYQGAEND